MVVSGFIFCRVINCCVIGFCLILLVICWLSVVMWLFRCWRLLVNLISRVWKLLVSLFLMFLSYLGKVWRSCWMFNGVMMLYLFINLCIWLVLVVCCLISFLWIWWVVWIFCCVIVFGFINCIFGWFIVLYIVFVLIWLFLLFFM